MSEFYYNHNRSLSHKAITLNDKEKYDSDEHIEKKQIVLFEENKELIRKKTEDLNKPWREYFSYSLKELKEHSFKSQKMPISGKYKDVFSVKFPHFLNDYEKVKKLRIVQAIINNMNFSDISELIVEIETEKKLLGESIYLDFFDDGDRGDNLRTVEVVAEVKYKYELLKQDPINEEAEIIALSNESTSITSPKLKIDILYQLGIIQKLLDIQQEVRGSKVPNQISNNLIKLGLFKQSQYSTIQKLINQIDKNNYEIKKPERANQHLRNMGLLK